VTEAASQSPSKSARTQKRWIVSLLAVLAILGPGLIAANAGNDAGGVLTYASAGSQFGYRTLFLMVLITVALVVVQEMCSRLGVYTGEGLGGLIREQFSARSTFGALSLLLIANAGLTVSEFAGVGAAMQIFGVSQYISIPIAAAAVWGLTVLGSYSRAERLFLVLVLAFLTYPVAAFLGHPNGKEVISNLVWPHFLATRSFLVLAVALIGTTITCRVHLFIQCPDLGLHRAPVRGVRPSVRQEDRGLVEPPTSGATAPSSSQEAAGQSAHRVLGPNTFGRSGAGAMGVASVRWCWS
jgi:Mn2+/Fe2+ NRAMP family transporter